jgi:hypothetical protein
MESDFRSIIKLCIKQTRKINSLSHNLHLLLNPGQIHSGTGALQHVPDGVKPEKLS